jgi:hypothetical protein
MSRPSLSKIQTTSKGHVIFMTFFRHRFHDSGEILDKRGTFLSRPNDCLTNFRGEASHDHHVSTIASNVARAIR